MSDFETLLFSIDAGIARITLNRPESANGLNLKMATELLDTAIACRTSDAVRAVLLSGNGKMFCAGGDLKSFRDNSERLENYVSRLTTELHAALSHFARMRAPLIVAVNGAAAGAGFSLAAAGDLVLAGRSAKFTMAYTAAGLVPDGGSSYFLPRIIGLRRTQELMLTNRRLSADEALDWGLISRVVDDAELPNEAEKLAEQIASGPTGSYGAVKKLLASTFQAPLETQMEMESAAISRAAVSADGREGVTAFFDKRLPAFTGR